MCVCVCVCVRGGSTRFGHDGAGAAIELTTESVWVQARGQMGAAIELTHG